MTIRPDPQRAERNLRNAVKVFTPYMVQVYGQDLVDVLAELDRLRAGTEQAQAAAVTVLELSDPTSIPAMRVAARSAGL